MDYHDYIIKDGVFVGKFEEVYQMFDDPWHQIDDAMQSYSKMCSIASLKRIGAANVLEIGCGLGYYTDFLHRALPDVRFTGMDISETAINKAKNIFPDLEFICADITDNDFCFSKVYDAIIFAEIMWYILDSFDEMIGKVRHQFCGKYVLINQTFYNGNQKYGTEYFTSQDEMIKRMHMKCIRKVREMTDNASYSTHTLLYVD